MNFICAIYLFIWIAKASPEGLQKNLKRIPAVDALIHRLEGEEWADDEEACFGDTLRILKGVQNDTLWATWIWDSMQPPMGVFYGNGLHLGHFDQCIQTPWSSELSTQYCMVEVKSEEPREPREFGAYDSADEYLNTLSPHRRTFNHLGFGACMPAGCSPSSVAKFVKHMLHLSHFPDIKDITVDPGYCQTAKQEPYPGKFYAFSSVFGALLVIVLISTIYSNCNESKERSTVDAIAESFSMTQNWTDLFKVNQNDMKVLNGIRVITSVLVVGCHQGLLSLYNPTLLMNSVEFDVILKNEIGEAVSHMDLIVDTFFPISGLLLMKGLMSGRQKNLLIVLLKRYFRLIGPYAAATFYIMCVARHTTTGPMWLKGNANEEGVCEKYWWKNFFMIGYDMKTMCYGLAWYVNCDYHLAIMTVILFWIYRRSKRSGVIAFAAVSCALTVQLAVNAYRKRLVLSPFTNTVALANIREYEVMNEAYIRWHDRAGSYLVGIATGWLMSLYKPADHRNCISKTTSFIITLVSLYIMMKVATLNHWLGDGSRLEVAVAIATNRAVWAIAICAIIAVCEYGTISGVSDFLCSSFFVPLSKLSYGIYMTHFFLIQRNLHVMRSPLKFDIFNVVICTLGTSVLSCVVGLVIYLLVEAPCINLSNLCLSERTVKKELNGTKSANGIHQNETNGIPKLKES